MLSDMFYIRWRLSFFQVWVYGRCTEHPTRQLSFYVFLLVQNGLQGRYFFGYVVAVGVAGFGALEAF